MRILAYKQHHDGAIAYLRDGQLVFSLEAEKNSGYRNDETGPISVMAAHSRLDALPDAVAVGGWYPFSSRTSSYVGLNGSSIISRDIEWFGRRIKYFSSSHERSHLMQAYGMSPFEQGKPVYVLLWEGGIGRFYEIDEALNITDLGEPLSRPGERYAALFEAAQGAPGDLPLRLSSPGKLMALAAFGRAAALPPEDQAVIDRLVDPSEDNATLRTSWRTLACAGIGVESQRLKDLARVLTGRIFDIYCSFAEANLRKGYPLLITGGCGLNCDWNSRWRASGLFEDVFVAPCSNDSGSAIGTAVDAQFHLTGDAKIEWSVYAGEEFEGAEIGSAYRGCDLDYSHAAALLANGAVLAWVQGRYEIGPRALGNRSLLAAPFCTGMLQRLNEIKNRESYRPIAPVCLEEDMPLHFSGAHPSPFMLYFFPVKNGQLRAVTHVDGTARPQSVTAKQNPPLYKLLQAFKQLTGVGVLCNTSLNFPGKGFINNTADLIEYQRARKLDAIVIGDKLWLPETVAAPRKGARPNRAGANKNKARESRGAPQPLPL